MAPGIRLRPISAESAEALASGRTPRDVLVAADHPTEFFAEMVKGGHARGVDGAERMVAHTPVPRWELEL